jgi:WD40 repeat protein
LRFLYDAWRFVRQNHWIVDRAPFQLYSSALVFAPETSVIRNTFKDQIPKWIRRMPKVPSGWSPELQLLEGHDGLVTALVFSPDGQLLASASNDYTIQLWNPAIGEELFTLQGHSGCVNTLALCHDRQLLASGSDDYKVILVGIVW